MKIPTPDTEKHTAPGQPDRQTKLRYIAKTAKANGRTKPVQLHGKRFTNDQTNLNRRARLEQIGNHPNMDLARLMALQAMQGDSRPTATADAVIIANADDCTISLKQIIQIIRLDPIRHLTIDK